MPRSNRRAKVTARLRKERHAYCIERRDANRRERERKRDADQLALQKVVNRLTNWQRGRWARAGYPGLRERRGGKVEPFLGMERGAQHVEP